MDCCLLALLLAQAAKDGQPQPSWWTPLTLLLPMLVLFYLIVLRPQSRQEQVRRSMISALKKHDRIVNHGGIIGVVEQIKDKEDEVVLKGGVRITKSSIVRVFEKEKDDDKDKDSKEKDKE